MALALGLLAPCTALAQGSDKDKGELKSYNYFEAQGGIQLTPTDVTNNKLITGTAGLSFGRFFSHGVGLRLHVNGWKSKSGFKLGDESTYYNWNYITSDIDVLLNLNHIFGKKQHYAVNVMLLGGVGLNTAWGNDGANSFASDNPTLNMNNVWDGTKLSHNIRAGVRLETDVTKPIGVSLEVAANSLNDHFNSKYSNCDDWMITAMLGVSVRFGHKYKTKPVPPAPAPEPKPEPKPAPAPAPPAPKPEPAPAPKPEPKPETLREEKFYDIRGVETESPQAQLQRVADYMKRNPEAKIKITGYADKQTGTAAVNMKYSKQRAENFKEQLVKDYGVDANRIITEAKGDTVQPFSENDKNRCIIIIGPAE